jgi:hypothetical protein
MADFKGTYDEFVILWLSYTKKNKQSRIAKPSEFIEYNISSDDLKRELVFRNKFYNGLAMKRGIIN